MNLDPRTVVILTILSTLLMGVSLFVVARGYLSQMRGVTRWATGTLLQSSGWVMLALIGVAPAYIAEIGSPLIMLGLALYYHALVAFKQSDAKTQWAYVIVAINVLLIYLFLLVFQDMSARIVIASATGAILMYASAHLLLKDGWKNLSFSHRITGLLFALCSTVLVVRAAYYLFWNTSPDQSAFEHNLVQDIAFLTFFLAGVVSSFTFILMCNDRYNEQSKHRAEELALKNVELEEANQAKGQFLATMSHEIRTPLNGVMGFLSQLEKTRLNDQQRDYLLTINHSARMLMGVINDVLDYSKIEAGKLVLEETETDLRQFLDDLVAMYSASADEKLLNFSCIVDHRLNSSVMVDSLRLTQILSNLVSNAIKFTSEGGVVVEAQLVAESDAVISAKLSVKDTGIGIAQQDMVKLFQPFSQADVSTTRKFGGTGLGLIIAKRLVEMMGGRIDVTSEEGRGTLFTLDFELKKSISQHSPLINAFSGKVKYPVLIASNDSNVCRSISENLIYLGVDYRIATGGLAAVRLLNQDKSGDAAYSMIFLDLAEENVVSGISNSISNLKLSADLPQLVLLCRMGQCRQLNDFDEMQFVRCLTKPVRAKDLYKIIGEHCGLGHTRENVLADSGANENANNKLLFGKRALIVDDNAINRKLAQILVEQMGGEFDAAENGLKAVEACRNRKYDLILMDVNMPEMDGIQASQTIHNENTQQPGTLFVALTANALPGDRERFISAGMHDYLSKPVSESALMSVLRKWWGSTAATSNMATGNQKNTPVVDLILDPELGISQSLDDEQTWHVVLGMVLDDLTEYAEMFSTLTVADHEKIANLAHKLAGSASYCGTPALYQTAKKLEYESVQGNESAILLAKDKMISILQRMISLDESGKLRGSKVVVY